MKNIIHNKADRRKRRVRLNIIGDNNYPRLSIFRSNKFIYAQLIDDVKQVTLASASDMKITEKMPKLERATKVGEEIAKKILTIGIKKVVFDRGSYRYMGRAAAVAEGARKAGLEI